MTYNINSYNGQLITKVPDGTIDNNSLAIGLIGRNSVNFGEAINENFVKLLKNFSSVTAPDNAIKGQLWFDATLGKLKVFDGIMWKPTGGAIVSPTKPANLVDGDIWINSNERRAYFYDGNSASTILMGPAYSRQQGKSGFEIISVVDENRRTHTVSALFVQDVLLGIFAKSGFTLGDNSATLGSTWTSVTVVPGFNSADIAGLLFDVTSTSTTGLKLPDDTIKSTAEVAYLTEENTFTSPQAALGTMRRRKKPKQALTRPECVLQQPSGWLFLPIRQARRTRHPGAWYQTTRDELLLVKVPMKSTRE